MFGPCHTDGDCCGPGSECCANTGPHEHPAFEVVRQLWVCRHGKTLGLEGCNECDDDDSSFNRHPNGWHYVNVEDK